MLDKTFASNWDQRYDTNSKDQETKEEKSKTNFDYAFMFSFPGEKEMAYEADAVLQEAEGIDDDYDTIGSLDSDVEEFDALRDGVLDRDSLKNVRRVLNKISRMYSDDKG